MTGFLRLEPGELLMDLEERITLGIKQALVLRNGQIGFVFEPRDGYHLEDVK